MALSNVDVSTLKFGASLEALAREVQGARCRESNNPLLSMPQGLMW